MSFVLAKAYYDGDYLPNSTLSLQKMNTWTEVTEYIYETIESFIQNSSLNNPNSGEMQLTHFMWENPHEIKEPSYVQSIEVYLSKIKKILERFGKCLIDELKFVEKLIVFSDDDDNLTFQCSTGKENMVKFYYNLAPNMNKFEEIRFKIIKL